MWKEKKETWENVVNSLGEDCSPSFPDPPTPCEDFNDPYDLHVKLCDKMMLPIGVANRLKKEMQDCLDDTQLTIDALEEEVNAKRALKGYDATADENKDTEDKAKKAEAMKKDKAEKEALLAALNKSCFNEIDININFKPLSNKPAVPISKETSDQLQKLADVLGPNPTLTITITGNAAGRKEDKTFLGMTVASAATPTTPVDIDEEIDTPYEPLDNYNEKIKNADGSITEKKEENYGDLAMIRAYYIRKLILDATAADGSKVDASQISVKLGTVKGTMSASINFN